MTIVLFQLLGNLPPSLVIEFVFGRHYANIKGLNLEFQNFLFDAYDWDCGW
jgi:hypothetical protein